MGALDAGYEPRIAAWCLVPLAAWVAFASVLNIAIWRLNG
jgi:translocator protein